MTSLYYKSVFSIIIIALGLLLGCKNNNPRRPNAIVCINNDSISIGVQDNVEKLYSVGSTYNINDCVSYNYQHKECNGIYSIFKNTYDSLGVRDCIVVVIQFTPNKKILGVDFYSRSDVGSHLKIIRYDVGSIEETRDSLVIDKYLYVHQGIYVLGASNLSKCIGYCFWYEKPLSDSHSVDFPKREPLRSGGKKSYFRKLWTGLVKRNA